MRKRDVARFAVPFILVAIALGTVFYGAWIIGIGCNSEYWSSASEVSSRIYEAHGAPAVHAYADKQTTYCTSQAFHEWARWYDGEADRDRIRQSIVGSP